MRGRTTAAALLALTFLGGCGGSNGYDSSGLDHGRATGPGFTFRLPDGWKAYTPREAAAQKIRRGVESKVKGLDTRGLLISGFWAHRGDKRRPIVDVVVEPVTEDTLLGPLTRSSARVANSSDAVVSGVTTAARLGPDPAGGYSTVVHGSHGRTVVATHGPYAYTLTVEMRPGHDADLTALTRSIARSWRWRALASADAKKLAPLARAGGTGYRTVLPPGWRATSKATLERAGQSGYDGLWRGWVGANGSTSVGVRTRQAPSGVTLEQALSAVAASERQTTKRLAAQVRLTRLTRGAKREIGGEPAGTLELALVTAQGRVRTREVVVLHAGRAYGFTLSSTPARFAHDAAQFATALNRLRWTS
jgi:hypothetical protein